MKKIIASILASSLIFGALAGCGHSHNEIKEKAHDGKLQVVCSIYPIYDWLDQVAGDVIDVTYLLESGVDLHNYQPSVTDMVTIKESDLFVYTGGHSDTWVADVIEDSTSALIMLGELAESDLISSTHVHTEECTDVDCGNPDHDHSADETHEHHDEDHDHHDEDVHIHDETCDHSHDFGEFDEHFWMSLKQSATAVQSIVDALCIMDPANADTFKANGSAYIAEMNALDQEFSDAISSAKNNTIVVADRFPLHYLVNDYSINHYAAFDSCTAESEVSFSTLTDLVTQVKDHELDYVLVIDGSDQKVANTVASEAGGVEILMINSMQTITSKDISNGVSYLEMMKENLEILKTVLN